MLTLMDGLAFMKSLLADWVSWPSVPRPDSAKTIDCCAAPPELEAVPPLVVDFLQAVAASPTSSTQPMTDPRCTNPTLTLHLLRPEGAARRCGQISAPARGITGS